MKKVKCPRCGQPSSLELSNRFRPFCCERCRTIDLGRWASEEFKFSDPEEADCSPPANVNKNHNQESEDT